MWKLRLFALCLIAIGGVLLAFGIYIELELRERRGGGFGQWLSNLFYTSEIEHYRNITFHFLVFAPAAIVLGFVIWALVSWRRRVVQAREVEHGLLTLSPKARKDILNRNLSGRRLAKELRKIQQK